jgi:hypothetical protein
LDCTLAFGQNFLTSLKNGLYKGIEPGQICQDFLAKNGQNGKTLQILYNLNTKLTQIPAISNFKFHSKISFLSVLTSFENLQNFHSIFPSFSHHFQKWPKMATDLTTILSFQ